MKKLLLLLFITNNYSFAQTITDVATGEYSTQYVKADGTVWVTAMVAYDAVYAPRQVAGLSGIVEADGGQYNSVFRKSDGTAYSAMGSSVSSTVYPTDYNGNAFTCDKLYAMWRMMVAIKNGEVWYWSANNQVPEDMLKQFGALATPVPAPRKLIQPAGKVIVKCVHGSSISPYSSAMLWGLAADGTLWQWDQTHTTPFQVTGKPGFSKTWTGAVKDIAINSAVNMVVTTTNEVWCWGYNAADYGGHAAWANTDMDNIAPGMTGAGIAFPLKALAANYVCIQAIDANNTRFGIGNNQTGSLGSGYMAPSWRTNWNGAINAIYSYDYITYNGNQGTWLKLPGKWKSVKTNTSFAFYSYGQDMAGNWYSWGRAKSQGLGNGFTWKGVDQSTYPDWRDIPAPRLVNPLTATWTVDGTVNPAMARAPIANAGINEYLSAGVTATTVYGSGSHQDQPTNTTTVTMTNAWTTISGPTAPTITSPASQNTTVTALVTGTYVFRNTVTNSLGVTDYQEVSIVIDTLAGNKPPVANAGVDTSITLPVNTVTLNGSATDADGSIASYKWTKISGPALGTIATPSAASTVVNNLVQGIYLYQFTATDNNGAINNDTVQVTVNAAINKAPVANAGVDTSITLPVNSTTLNGSAIDTDGSIASYKWTKISGPALGSIATPSAASTGLNNLVQGVYRYQFTATDNNGAIDNDTVQVTVNAAINIAPVANAGVDTSITLPVNSTILNGSATDADGSIASYKWTKISGPALGTIATPSAASTVLNNLVQGIYLYQFTATDNNGAINNDTVQVTVNAAINKPPVANAGVDTSITLPVNSTTLNGSATDADGSIASYKWTKISGPALSTIATPSAASTGLNNLVQGVYLFQFTATDNSGAIDNDTVQVTVNAAINLAPVANAGADTSITLPVNTVTLNGSATDADGSIASYKWTKISGPALGTIATPSAASTVLNNLVQGIYLYQFTATDNNGAINNDTVQVTVNAAINIAPVANAGADTSITLPVNSTTLNGSATDADGSIASYKWTKISGPALGTIATPSAASTVVNNLVQGVYIYQFTATDNNGAINNDTVQVTVNAAINKPPVANAGVDTSITLPVNSTTLNGSATDADGSIASYKWTKISGPALGTIATPSAASTVLNNLVQGIYLYQFTATDNNGAINNDTVQVTVNAAINKPPVANAGVDTSITLPVNSTTLNGSAIDTDGSIASYKWTKISGPALSTIATPSAASTGLNNLVQGVYLFQFTATDNSGAIDNDTVQVTVNAAINLAPVANAGADISITLPVNTVTLNGSATDADGSIASYKWTKISDPALGTIVTPSAASTVLNNLVQGVYLYQFTATDNSGAIDNDTVQVTVNAAINLAPVANAGADISITLPVNSTTLNGSATDADGSIASYKWTKISGPALGSIATPSAASTGLNNLAQGIYLYQFTATDNSGAIDNDTVQVTVNTAINKAPVANAGADTSITLPVNSTTLNGSATDADGSIASYKWTKISGPALGTIVTPSAASTGLNNLVQGIYLYQFTATDNNGAINNDTVQVTVNAAINKAPVANAGADTSITLPVNFTTLNGSATDADGSIASYKWTKISGPALGTIATPSAASTVVNNLVQGVYIYQFTATDNNGAADYDTVQIIVNAAKNIAPVANAGPDINIYLPQNFGYLMGSGTDVDGVIVSYHWRVISATAQFTLENPDSLTARLINLQQGVYEVELKVTDNQNKEGLDTVKVFVGSSRIDVSFELLNVYPNPVRDVLNIKINTKDPGQTALITMFNLNGAQVYYKQIKITGMTWVETVDVSNFNKGAYLVQINIGSEKAVVKKIVKL